MGLDGRAQWAHDVPHDAAHGARRRMEGQVMYAYQAANGQWVTMNGMKPFLTNGKGNARFHQTIEKAEWEKPIIEEAIGQSVNIVNIAEEN